MSTTLLDKRETRIRSMFGHIAPRYDLLNHLLSLNVDKYWRWRTTRLVPPTGTAPILDLCTGTGDLALAYDRAAEGRVEIVGADFCHEMLLPAVKKTEKRKASTRIRFVEADAQRLPFPDRCVSDHMCGVWITQRHRYGSRAGGNGARDETGRPGGDSRVLAADALALWKDCTGSTFAACCPSSANFCRAARTAPTITCRPASWSFPTAKRSPNACAATD